MTTLTMTPQLQQAIKMLQLSRVDLVDFLRDEAAQSAVFTIELAEAAVLTAPDVFVDASGVVSPNTHDAPRLIVDVEAARTDEDSARSAMWLHRALSQREKTIVRVCEALVSLQATFFSTGNPQDLLPLSLIAVADAVEMHPSTIQRVCHDKHMETPHGSFALSDLVERRERGRNPRSSGSS